MKILLSSLIMVGTIWGAVLQVDVDKEFNLEKKVKNKDIVGKTNPNDNPVNLQLDTNIFLSINKLKEGISYQFSTSDQKTLETIHKYPRVLAQKVIKTLFVTNYFSKLEAKEMMYALYVTNNGIILNITSKKQIIFVKLHELYEQYKKEFRKQVEKKYKE